ncbi:ABC transporter ATP-binding protein [Microbacterium sp. BK668]|uniref:ABC transporter ATP-binding protein n=1 Tax=Microbacterium sp. BK668 TaxID=2512118 RepID=UPI00105B9F85|nr:ABC transporter ATP-binding protein [Microbacterium sp. BK668]TDN88393.1 ABC-2 type transport system ATP-binding protein [Microbacterium sp. BK668]
MSLLDDDRTKQDTPEVIAVNGVSKYFIIRKDNSLKERVVTLGRRGRAHQEEFQALHDVTLSIKAGTTIGLLGTNGSGKSTLLKIIGGIIDPTAGSVQRRGRLAALLELGAGFHPDLSGRDNVYLNAAILGLSKEETDAQFDSIVAFAEIGDFIDTQVKFYSSGMYVRLAFAVAVHTDPDVLLVDEVLAVGDEAFQRKCMDKIRQFQSEGRTIVLVSHSAAQVMEVCDEGVVLRNGEVAFIGSAAEATRVHREILEGKRKQAVAVQEELENQKEEVRRPSSEIVAVTLEDLRGHILEEALPGQDVRICVRVRHDRALPDWNTGISIDTPTGQQVLGTGTRRLGTSHGPVGAGETEISYVLRDLHFAGGQYFVNARIEDEEGQMVDVEWQALSFFVPMEHRQTGTVYADISVN